jgi:hypothetical protein
LLPTLVNSAGKSLYLSEGTELKIVCKSLPSVRSNLQYKTETSAPFIIAVYTESHSKIALIDTGRAVKIVYKKYIHDIRANNTNTEFAQCIREAGQSSGRPLTDSARNSTARISRVQGLSATQ